MIRTILVPVDGSSFSERAIPMALNVARYCRASVEFLFVHSPMEVYSELMVFDAPLDVTVRAHEQAYLDKIVQERSQKTSVPLSSAHRVGHVPDLIRDHSQAIGADLIVMTTHARGSMGRFWLGSVSDTLIRTAPVPLLLVHPDGSPEQHASVDNILIALDGTALAEGVLEHATRLAEAMGAGLTLVRIVKPPVTLTVPVGAASFAEMGHHPTGEVEKLQKSIVDDASAYLERVAGPLRRQGFRVTTRVEEEDQPARGILGVNNVDMIAMATHGRRGLARFFLGSVADKVLRGAHVPLLLCRPQA